MWVHGINLDHYQLASAVARGYTKEQAGSLVWYVTADGRISERHKPRQGGLADQDVNLILTALAYLRRCPHLDMLTNATSQDVAETIERVTNELYGYGDESGTGSADD